MEHHDSAPAFDVQDAEYHRLLGWPRGHVPAERARELMAWARQWYAQHGRPWTSWRGVTLETTDGLQLDGVRFASAQLEQHLREHEAREAVLVAVSAGPECEEHARQLWNEGRPDEYFFLEMYGSAVAEDLVARMNGRLCTAAGARGLMAVPHYSPGYAGWDVAEQNKLFDLVVRAGALPGPLEVLSSGMLRPKKSLLAVFGLAAARPVARATPCERCAFTPCHYRRTAYRHAPAATAELAATAAPASPAPRYSVNTRALRKWASERVRVELRADGTVEAVFRFDGTTCSHRPLAFDYRVSLAGPNEGYRILGTGCTPAAEDDGYQHTCSYLADGEGHLREIAAAPALVGRPLGDVLGWERASAPAGCHCTADSREHKWGLALEAIHYALAQQATPVS